MLHMDEEDLVTTINHCIRACSCRRALWQGKTLKLFCLLCLFLPLYPSWSNMENKRWVWWQDHPTMPKKLLPIESFCRYPLDLTCANALWMNIFQKYFPKRFCWMLLKCMWWSYFRVWVQVKVDQTFHSHHWGNNLGWVIKQGIKDKLQGQAVMVRSSLVFHGCTLWTHAQIWCKW